jgi:hypothetical protein
VRRTRPLFLVLFAIIGGGAGWLLQSALTSLGAAAIVPPVTLALTLVAIGAVVIIFAIPVRRSVRDRDTKRVDPFYATRVVVLAKAASVAGALLFGSTASIVVYLLTRNVVAGVGSIFTSSAAVIGSIILLACGLIAENMCSIPPDDQDKGEESRAEARPH